MFAKCFSFLICLLIPGIVSADTMHPPLSVVINGQVRMTKFIAKRLLKDLGRDVEISENNEKITIKENKKDGLLKAVTELYLESKKPGVRSVVCKPERPNDLSHIHVDRDGVVDDFILCD